MYQINLRTQAGKLAALAAGRPFARVQQHAAEPSLHTSYMRAVLATLANLATLRVLPSSALESAERHDPRNPHNW